MGNQGVGEESYQVYVRMCVRASMHVSVYMCVCKYSIYPVYSTRPSVNTLLSCLCVCVPGYSWLVCLVVYVYVCLCVHVKKRQSVCACVRQPQCVCVCAHVCV